MFDLARTLENLKGGRRCVVDGIFRPSVVTYTFQSNGYIFNRLILVLLRETNVDLGRHL